MFSVHDDVFNVYCGAEWDARIPVVSGGQGLAAQGTFYPSHWMSGTLARAARVQNLGHFGVGTIMDLLSQTSDVSPSG